MPLNTAVLQEPLGYSDYGKQKRVKAEAFSLGNGLVGSTNHSALPVC